MRQHYFVSAGGGGASVAVGVVPVVPAGAVVEQPVPQPPTVPHPVLQVEAAGAQQVAAAGAQQLVAAGAQQLDVVRQHFVRCVLQRVCLQQRFPASAPFTNRATTANAATQTIKRRIMSNLLEHHNMGVADVDLFASARQGLSRQRCSNARDRRTDWIGYATCDVCTDSAASR